MSIEKLIKSAGEWGQLSIKGVVCGILGCEYEPTTKCSHCQHWYCEEHKFVIGTPAHPVEK